MGTSMEVETIHGKRQISVLGGAEHNQQVVIKGAGLVILGSGESDKSESRGDHIITVKVDMPKNLNAEQKEALSVF